MAGDMLTAAHIHMGDPVTNGAVFKDFMPTFSGNMAMGKVQLTADEANKLMMGGDFYINIHSTQAPNGIVRGQIGMNVVASAMDIMLTSSVMGRSETGMAYLRTTTDNKLYYSVMVNNLKAGDMLTMAHIHDGAMGTTGGVFIDFGNFANGMTMMSAMKMLSSADMTKLTGTMPMYVNVHSMQEANGLVRGQIR
jgi:CHRD domain